MARRLPESLIDRVRRLEHEPETYSSPDIAHTADNGLAMAEELKMTTLALSAPILMAAAGYSLIYLLLGGGIGGAILIFVVAKMLGQ